MPTPKFDKERFLKAFKKTRGQQQNACRIAHTNAETVNKHRKTDPEFNRQYEEILNETKEYVIGKLMEQIDNGNLTATIFYLKTQCHWSEKQIVAVENDNKTDVIEELRKIRKKLNE